MEIKVGNLVKHKSNGGLYRVTSIDEKEFNLGGHSRNVELYEIENVLDNNKKLIVTENEVDKVPENKSDLSEYLISMTKSISECVSKYEEISGDRITGVIWSTDSVGVITNKYGRFQFVPKEGALSEL